MQQRGDAGRKMLQGVGFAIHVSYLDELRAENAGAVIATLHITPRTFIQMYGMGQGGAHISSLVNLLMQGEIGGPEGKGQSNINLTCR